MIDIVTYLGYFVLISMMLTEISLETIHIERRVSELQKRKKYNFKSESDK